MTKPRSENLSIQLQTDGSGKPHKQTITPDNRMPGEMDYNRLKSTRNWEEIRPPPRLHLKTNNLHSLIHTRRRRRQCQDGRRVLTSATSRQAIHNHNRPPESHKTQRIKSTEITKKKEKTKKKKSKLHFLKKIKPILQTMPGWLPTQYTVRQRKTK